MIHPIDYVIDLGLGCVIIGVGVVTNCLNIRVFWRQGFSQHQVNVTLLTLALSDLACLLCAALYRLSYLLYALLPAQEFTCWHLWVTLPIGLGQVGLTRVTYSLTALISLERYVSVCHPLRAKSWLCKRNLTRATVITAVVSVVVNVPLVMINSYTGLDLSAACDSNAFKVCNETTNSTPGTLWVNVSTQLTPETCFDTNATSTEAGNGLLPLDDSEKRARVLNRLTSRDSTITYTLICSMIVVPALCNYVVSSCTIAILLKLRKMSKKRLSLSEISSDQSSGDLAGKSCRREARLVKTILAVMIIFIVCHLPTSTWAHVVLFSHRDVLEKRPHLNIHLMTGFVFLETLNSSVNFFVYISCFPGFRQTFTELYPLCQPRAQKSSGSRYSVQHAPT